MVANWKVANWMVANWMVFWYSNGGLKTVRNSDACCHDTGHMNNKPFEYRISKSFLFICLLFKCSLFRSPLFYFSCRLKNSAEEICEILLSKGHVLSAVRYARGRGIESVPAQKFLEASKVNNEDFFTVYTFLKERSLLPRGCAEYTKHFQTLFGTE